MEAAEQAYTITAWLTHHREAIDTLPLRDMEADLFASVRHLLIRHRVNPTRLRTRHEMCSKQVDGKFAGCGGIAVVAEWTVNANGDLAVTKQCTRCGERYEPTGAEEPAEVAS